MSHRSHTKTTIYLIFTPFLLSNKAKRVRNEALTFKDIVRNMLINFAELDEKKMNWSWF